MFELWKNSIYIKKYKNRLCLHDRVRFSSEISLKWFFSDKNVRWALTGAAQLVERRPGVVVSHTLPHLCEVLSRVLPGGQAECASPQTDHVRISRLGLRTCIFIRMLLTLMLIVETGLFRGRSVC